MYKKLRKYNGAYFPQIDGYVGLRNNRVYYRSGNNIKIIGFNYSSANFTTHYRSGDAVVEMQRVVLPENADKILQELYIIFGQSDITDVVMYVYVDNWLMGSRIFNTGRVDKWLSDLGVRFGKIKFKIVIPAGKKVRISEFGCSYVLDSKEPLGNIYYEDLGAGFGSEFGTEFGQT